MRCGAVLSVASLVVFMVGNASAGPAVTGDLSFYYGFDSVGGDGTTVTDGSGNGYDGTVSGNVTQTTGPNGNAALFWHEGVDETGTNNFIDLPVGDIASGDIPTSGFTLAAWYKVSFTTNPQAIFCPLASDNTWLLHPELRGQATPTESYYRFTARGYAMTNIGTVNAGQGDPNEGPNWDVWTHVAMTYDKNAQIMKVYEDGNVIGQTVPINSVDLAADWDLGARIGCTVDNGRQFLGELDEIYIFTRALTKAEIEKLATPSLIGDANVDGMVNENDAAVLAENWLTDSGATWRMGDFNKDGKVNDADAVLMAANWHAGVTTSAGVPEPGMTALLAAGLMALTILRRRS